MLDEELDEKEVSYLGSGPLGTALVIIGFFLISNSINNYCLLNDILRNDISSMMPTEDGIIFHFILGIIAVINGFLFFRKNDKPYYLLITIISGIFTYCLFLFLSNVSFTTIEILIGFIEYFFKSLFLLILNFFLIIYLKNNKEKILNNKLLYISLGIIIGTIPFLLKDMIL